MKKTPTNLRINTLRSNLALERATKRINTLERHNSFSEGNCSPISRGNDSPLIDENSEIFERMESNQRKLKKACKLGVNLLNDNIRMKEETRNLDKEVSETKRNYDELCGLLLSQQRDFEDSTDHKRLLEIEHRSLSSKNSMLKTRSRHYTMKVKKLKKELTETTELIEKTQKIIESEHDDLFTHKTRLEKVNSSPQIRVVDFEDVEKRTKSQSWSKGGDKKLAFLSKKKMNFHLGLFCRRLDLRKKQILSLKSLAKDCFIEVNAEFGDLLESLENNLKEFESWREKLEMKFARAQLRVYEEVGLLEYYNKIIIRARKEGHVLLGEKKGCGFFSIRRKMEWKEVLMEISRKEQSLKVYSTTTTTTKKKRKEEEEEEEGEELEEEEEEERKLIHVRSLYGMKIRLERNSGFVLIFPGGSTLFLRASSDDERGQWLNALLEKHGS